MLGRETPRIRRRRRQTQRQSTCCCCSLVAVCIIVLLILFGGRLAGWLRERREQPRADTQAVADFPLNITIEQLEHYRYSLVEISLRVTDPKAQVTRVADPPLIRVWDSNMDLVWTVGGVKELTPRFDADRGRYVCHWPVPWNAKPGRYVVEAEMEIEDPRGWEWVAETQRSKGRNRETKRSSDKPTISGRAYCVAAQPFEVIARKPRELPPGICVATWEPDFPTGYVTRPDGTRGDWRAMFDWAEYIGADTLCFRGAVTTAYNAAGALTIDQPWVLRNIEAITRLGDEAHHRGLKFGAWAVAYETYPNKPTSSLPNPNKYKPPYQFAKDISRSTGRVSDMCWVSLLDENRIKHLTEFFKRLERMPQVDYIGMDYMRVEGAYEMSEQFAREMPLRNLPVEKLPADWDSRSQQSKWRYVATKVETEWNAVSGRDFYECWNWWRAHKCAEIVGRIIREGEITKPVWIFFLSWKRGMQHGQDALMFNDAGVSLIAPMLYQCQSFDHFDFLMEGWQEYLRPGQVNLVPGDQVDDYWHKRTGQQRSRRPAAPEVMYDRMTRAHKGMVPGAASIGAFWHDISRAAAPSGRSGRGPYPGREWALAGGAAFSKLRETWGVYPIKAELQVRDRAPIGARFETRVQIENLSERAVRNINIELQPTPQIVATNGNKKRIQSLGPGEKISVPVWVKIASGNSARANRFMVAARITWPRGKYGKGFRTDLPRVIIVMKYLNGT